MSVLNRVTPFISPIKTTGGTLYTFNSSAEDLTLSFNENSNNKFRFSKFALLNIPNIENNHLKNTVKLQAIAGAYDYVDINRTHDWNNHFAESFQNYCLNLENGVLSKDTYDRSLPKTVSERVFFKWLKEISAVRFESYIDPVESINAYKEESNNENYNRVVQYLGDIDFINNFNGNYNSYSEVYFHIPTNVGNFKEVYFKTTEDSNYYPGMAISREFDGVNNEYIFGRKSTNTNPSGLGIKAFYDNDTGHDVYTDVYTPGNRLCKRKSTATGYDLDTDYELDTWWYNRTTQTNVYYTEPSSFKNSTNEEYAIYDNSASNKELQSTKFKRTKLDGIEIDFNNDLYYYNRNDLDRSLYNYAASPISTDFEFNAILIYYDIYKEYIESGYDNGDIKYRETLATNLFGILFLDNVENDLSIGGGYIPRFKKCKPNDVLNLNGNSYGFKLNLKLDVNSIDTPIHVETIVSDSNTLSMDIFADSINEYRKAMESLSSLNYNTAIIDNRLSELEYKYEIESEKSTITDESLEDKYNKLLITTTNSLDLIDKLNRKIDSVLNNNEDKKLAFDTSIIKQGNGILIDRSNGVTINSVSEYYNITDQSYNSIKNDWIKMENQYMYTYYLKPLNNIITLYDTDPTFIIDRDLYLYINSDIMWNKGQSLYLYFENKYNLSTTFGNYNFYILTGNETNGYEYIIKMNSYEFSNFGNSLNIVSRNANNKDFFVFKK